MSLRARLLEVLKCSTAFPGYHFWRDEGAPSEGAVFPFLYLISMNNQEAFDTAVLHLLNQAQRCVNSSGQSQYRGARGCKNAIGALIPDHLYWNSMDPKTVAQMLVATGPGYEKLREHFSGVAPRLLNELQDLHDRTGNCLPSLFRDIVLAGGYRIAQMFGLSLRMMHLWVVYRKIPGPQMPKRVERGDSEGAAGPAPRSRRTEERELVA